MDKNNFINANSAKTFHNAVKAQNEAMRKVLELKPIDPDNFSLDPSTAVLAEHIRTINNALSATNDLNAAISARLDELAQKQETSNQMLADSVRKSEEWHNEDSKSSNLALKVSIATLITAIATIAVTILLSEPVQVLLLSMIRTK